MRRAVWVSVKDASYCSRAVSYCPVLYLLVQGNRSSSFPHSVIRSFEITSRGDFWVIFDVHAEFHSIHLSLLTLTGTIDTSLLNYSYHYYK